MRMRGGFLVVSIVGLNSVGAAVHFESRTFQNSFIAVPQTYAWTQTITDEKKSRTPAQKKIDSQLLYALKQKRGVTKGVPAERIELEVDRKGRVLVDVTGDVSPHLIAQIQKLGGAIVSTHAGARTIRARLALQRLEELAQRKDVSFIAPAAQPMNNRAKPN